MKKYLLTLVVSFPALLALAQGDIVIKGTKSISEQHTPKQVLDSLHARFPNAEAVRYYEENGADATRGWAISKEDNMAYGHEIEYYTISFKREGLNYYGLYDRDGKLMEGKIEQKVTDLPAPVAEALKNSETKYPGYKVVSKTAFHVHNYSSKKEYYEVGIQNGNTKKLLYFAPDGKL